MGTYSRAEAEQVPNQWWDVWDFFPNVSEREIENPYDHNWARRPEVVEQNYDKEGNLKESLQLNLSGYPVPKYTREGELYYTTVKNDYGQIVPAHLSNETWREKLPYPFGKKRDNLSDFAFASWLFNQAPSQLAPVGALAKGIPQIRNQRTLNKFKTQYTKVDENLNIADSFNVTPQATNQKNVERIFSLSRIKNTRNKGLIKDFTSGSLKKGGLFDPNRSDTTKLMYTSSGGSGEIAKDKRGNPLAPAEKVKANILSGILPEPTLEQLEMAIRGGGAQNKAGWMYDRNRVKGFPPRLRDRLRAEYGGTKAQAEEFRKEQLAHKRYMDDKVIPGLNEQFRLGYLIFFSTAKEIGGVDLPEFTTDMTWEDSVFDMYMRFLVSPSGSAVYDLGHIQAAKNIDLYSEPGVRTTADFSSNLEPEMKRSIKDFIMQETAGGGLAREGISRKVNYGEKDIKALRVVEPGNIKRSNTSDLPRILNLLSNVNPNVELEYIRWLAKKGYDNRKNAKDIKITKEFDDALTDIVDPMHQEALLAYVRKYIRKMQRGKTGEQQLRLYPKWIRKAIDDFLNQQYQAGPEEKAVNEAEAEKAYQVLTEDIETQSVMTSDKIHGELPNDAEIADMIDKWLQ